MIVHRRSGEEYPVAFHPLTYEDVDQMIKDGGPYSWEPEFNWSIYFSMPGVQAYKMVIQGNDAIQGCIAFEVKESDVFIHLIESAPHNFKGKEFERVGEHLIAFVCVVSRRAGLDGVVSFHVKTTRETYPLRKYYIQTIGATPINQSLYVVFEDVAERLIMLYS